MVIVANEDLKPDDELSFNYNFQRYGEGKQRCFCGSKSCKGVCVCISFIFCRVHLTPVD